MNHKDQSSTPSVPSYEVIRNDRDPDTMGLVIGNLDPTLREALGLPEDCHSIGMVTSGKKKLNTLFGADEAIK